MGKFSTSSVKSSRRFWSLIITMVFAVVCLVHIETSRAKTQERAQVKPITVERLPTAEAKRMGVDPRNN